MRVKFKSTAFLRDRYGVSDRATATAELNVLQDVGINTAFDSCYVIGKNKKKENTMIAEWPDKILISLSSTNRRKLDIPTTSTKTYSCSFLSVLTIHCYYQILLLLKNNTQLNGG